MSTINKNPPRTHQARHEKHCNNTKASPKQCGFARYVYRSLPATWILKASPFHHHPGQRNALGETTRSPDAIIKTLSHLFLKPNTTWRRGHDCNLGHWLASAGPTHLLARAGDCALPLAICGTVAVSGYGREGVAFCGDTQIASEKGGALARTRKQDTEGLNKLSIFLPRSGIFFPTARFSPIQFEGQDRLHYSFFPGAMGRSFNLSLRVAGGK